MCSMRVCVLVIQSLFLAYFPFVLTADADVTNKGVSVNEKAYFTFK